MLDPDLEVGAALKAARQSLGLTLDEVAEATRVRSRHLEALEAHRLEELPSRPFTIGYVRAYAKSLGLDADQVAQRFRAENPSPDDELHSPVGVAHESVGRNRALIALGAVAVIAVVGWNIALRATADGPKKPLVAVASHADKLDKVAAANAATGVFTVNTPLPAPPEATIPAPYPTPGLDAANANGSAAAADAENKATTAAEASKTAAETVGHPFEALGTIYGPTTGASNLVIQARKPILLEISGPGGAVYFARQLAAGESYRVPNLAGLTAEVSNPENAEIFEGGVSKGVFTTPQMPLKAG